MYLPNNFNRQIHWSDLLALLMVRHFHRSNLLVLFMVRKIMFTTKKVQLKISTMKVQQGLEICGLKKLQGF